MKTNRASPLTLRPPAFALLAVLAVCLAALPARAQSNYWGYALSFNGANSYLSIGAAPLTNSWTAEFWVNRLNSTNTAAAVLDDGITSLRLEQFNGTKLVGFTKYGVADYTFNYTAPTNTWVHLAFVSDKTNTYLYVNGVAQDTNANTVALPLRVFGAVTNGSKVNSAIKGTVDEIRIWNVARSAADIQADLAQPLANAPAGLVAYWQFDEASGTAAYDATTNHLDATLVNGPMWVVSTVPVPFTYTTNNGTITITGYTGTGGAATIPATIDGLPVTSIGANAFNYNSSLTSITIPGSVTSIEDLAFALCYSLSSITIPDSVTSIGWAAFEEDPLTSVTIPSRVTSIGAAAFEDCINLTNVTILGSDTSLEDYAFCGCSALTGVYFQGNAPILDGPFVFAATASSPGGLATVYYLAGTTGWSLFDAHSFLSPAVLWNPQAQTSDGDFGVRANGFGFNIAGTANIPIVVEAATNLTSASWMPLQSCTLTNGLIYFSDPQWTNYRARFYRVRWP